MSINPPPIISSPIFNPAFYQYAKDNITIESGDLRYLKLTGGSMTGLLTTQAGISIANGTLAEPSIRFSSDPGTGISPFFGVGAGIELSVSGTRSCIITGSSILSNNLGTVFFPAFSFFNDQNTGLYSPGADSLALTCGGIQTLRSTTTQLNLPLAGSVSTPSLYFSTDTTTGLYRSGANEIGITVSNSQKMKITSTGTEINGAKIGASGSTISQIQFGRTASSGASATINFPNAFSSIPTVSATLQISNTSYLFQIQITNVSTTGFTYYMYLETIMNPSQTTVAGDNCTINWIAIS